MINIRIQLNKFDSIHLCIDTHFNLLKVPTINGVLPMEDHLIYFAMVDLLSKKLPPESLVLLTEPNIELRTDYLNRVSLIF